MHTLFRVMKTYFKKKFYLQFCCVLLCYQINCLDTNRLRRHLSTWHLLILTASAILLNMVLFLYCPVTSILKFSYKFMKMVIHKKKAALIVLLFSFSFIVQKWGYRNCSWIITRQRVKMDRFSLMSMGWNLHIAMKPSYSDETFI